MFTYLINNDVLYKSVYVFFVFFIVFYLLLRKCDGIFKSWSHVSISTRDTFSKSHNSILTSLGT